jgi:hypothetical protein
MWYVPLLKEVGARGAGVRGAGACGAGARRAGAPGPRHVVLYVYFLFVYIVQTIEPPAWINWQLFNYKLTQSEHVSKIMILIGKFILKNYYFQEIFSKNSQEKSLIN